MAESRIVTTIPILGRVGINFFCISEKVLNLYHELDELSRQKNIKQLGLISNVVEGATHSRYEYLMLQVGITDLMDNLHKGSPTAAQGSIKINGKEYSGNAIIKSWFLLSNFGHAINTIADEKTLLHFALTQNGFKSNLLVPIRDEKLFNWSKNVIENFEYTKFHHILSLRKVYASLSRRRDLRDEILEIYKLLLLDESEVDSNVNLIKLAQLKRVFNTIRALSIVAIDGYYSHSPITVDLVPTILSIDTSESAYHGKFLLDSIEPLLSNLHEEIYLDKDVLAYERFYELESLKYCRRLPKKGREYGKLINKSLNEGIYDLRKNCSLKHFMRLAITPSMDSDRNFYDEFRNLQTVKRSCKGVEAHLDLNHITKQKYADFFINIELFKTTSLPQFIYNISKIMNTYINNVVKNSSLDFEEVMQEVKRNLLKQHVDSGLIDVAINDSRKIVYKNSWNIFKSDIFPTFKDLLWSILKFFLKDNYQIDINSNHKNYDSFGMRLAEGDIGLLGDNILNAIEAESEDEDRVHELKQLLKATERKFDGYVFACLSRIMIYDKTKAANKKVVTDIDSLVIKVNQDNLIIEFNESKNYRRSRERRATKELKSNFVQCLDTERRKGYRIKEVKGFGAKLVIKI